MDDLNVTEDCSDHQTLILRVYHWTNFILVSVILSLFGVISQLTVILVIKSVRKKTSTDVFLSGLAAVDLLILILLSLNRTNYMTSHVLTSTKSFESSAYRIALTSPFLSSSMLARTWCIMLSSFDRYLQICHTHWAKTRCTPENAKRQITCIVIVSLIYSMPEFYEYYELLKPEIMSKIYDQCDGNLKNYPIGSLALSGGYIWGYIFSCTMLASLVVPLGCLIFTNNSLIKVIRKSHGFRKRIKDRVISQAEPYDESKGPNRQGAIRILINLTIVFCVFQLPAIFTNTLIRIFPAVRWAEEAIILANDFITLSSSLNLVICIKSSKVFKKQLLIKLPCLKNTQTSPAVVGMRAKILNNSPRSNS